MNLIWMFQRKLRIYSMLSNLVNISFKISSHWRFYTYVLSTFKNWKIASRHPPNSIFHEMLTLFLYVRTTAHCSSWATVLEHCYQNVRQFHWARFPQLSLRWSRQTKQRGLLFQQRFAHCERRTFFFSSRQRLPIL